MDRDASGIGAVSVAMIAIGFYRKRRLALLTNGSIWRAARAFLPAWRLGPNLAWALLCWMFLGWLQAARLEIPEQAVSGVTPVSPGRCKSCHRDRT
jgi:hypothetical protein